MKKILKKILSLTLLASITIGASSTGLITQAKEITSPSKKIEVMNQKLIKYLESISPEEAIPSNIENFLQNNISEKEKLTGKEYADIANQSNEKVKSLQKKGYTSNELATAQVIDTVITENNLKVEILDNGVFSVENLNTPVKALASSGSVWGQAYKDYYSNVGVRIFTIAVGSGFAYDGNKASYYGNFTAYYTRGTLSIWQVSNWATGHEAVGTSYRAYAGGNFHYGVEYQGVGLIIQDLYVQHVVTCSKTGSISNNI